MTSLPPLRRRAAPVVLLVLAALVLAACTSGGDEPTPSSTPSGPEHRVPVALVAHHDRGLTDVTAAQVRSVLDGSADDWSDLGQPAEPLTIVATVDEVVSDPSAVAVVSADDVRPIVDTPTIDGVDPLTAGADAPVTAPSAEPAAEPVTITIAGDIMLGRRVGDLLESVGDPAAVLRPMAERLAAADVTVGNLESTLSQSGPPTQGSDSFGADPSVLAGLELAGFDVLSLANNHLGDYGLPAIVETVDVLRSAGFRTVGAGADLARASEPVLVEVGDVSIGFVATDSIGETPAATDSSPGTNRVDAPPRTGPFDHEAMERVAQGVRELDATTDVIIALPHWGTQYTNVPEQSQVQIAQALANAGADLVVGGHPHWVQGWQTVGGIPVVHSLGNFVFDMDFMVENTEGVLLDVVVRGEHVVSIAPVPYVIDGSFTPREVTGDRAAPVLDRLRETSEATYRGIAPR